MLNKLQYPVTWRPWAPRHKGYGLIAGESRGSSFPCLGRSDLPYLEQDLIFLFEFRNNERWPEWSADWRCTSERIDSQGIDSADVPESAAACPKSGFSVWYSDRRGSTFKFFRVQELQSPHSRQGARTRGSPRAAERKEDSAVQRKTEGGCEPWPGQPGRSDPKQWILSSGRGSLHYRLKEQADSRRRRTFGTMPEIIDKLIEGAVNSRKDDVRERSA